MEFIHPAMNAARLAVKSLPKQLPVKVPIIDTFFEVKKPVEESPSSPSSSDSERFSLSTRTNARSGKKIYSIYPDSPAEKSILNFYDEKYNFDKSDSLFCLFNPSFSTLPEKFLERRCRRLLILDSSKKSCDYWRRFKSNYADGDASAEINVEQLDFTHLPNQTLSDLKKGQPNTFGQILRKYGCRPQVYADEKAEAQANFIGVLPFFKERAFFLELLNTRLQSINLFEFGRVDFLVYVSASKYTVLDPACPTLFSRCKARRNMYSTFFDTKLIDKTKFDDQTATPGKSFTVDVNPEKGLYAQFLKKNCVDIDSAYLLHLKPKLDLHVPLISSARQQHDQTQLYKHFEYFNRQINLNMKNLADFLGNFFAGSEEILLNCEGDVSSRDNFLKRKCKSLNLDEEIQLFNRLRSWDGYEHCAFVHEAGKFVESSVLAVNDI